MSIEAPFGTWTSPITAELVTTSGVRLGDVKHSNGACFWAETRPEDNGRCIIVKAAHGEQPIDVTGAPYNVRTRVHEYGGGSWWVDEQHVYFVHWDDQRLYRINHEDVSASSLANSLASSLAKKNKPIALTIEPETDQALRYADGCISADKQWIICVRETHSKKHKQPINELVAIPNGNTALNIKVPVASNVLVLASGADFYSTPRLSNNATLLSWIQWSHPQMPWDGTELMVATIDEACNVGSPVVVAGDTNTSIMGALWAGNSELIYASDESGWWNLYSIENAHATVFNPVQLTHFTDREVGTPAWVFGTQRFVVVGVGEKRCCALAVTHQAQDELLMLGANGAISTIAIPLTTISSIAADSSGAVLIQGQSTTAQASIVRVSLDPVSAQATHTPPSITTLRQADELAIDEHWYSNAQAITYPSGDKESHAFFYPPAGLNYRGAAGELPPLIVMGHGGPTSHANAGLKLSVQYWTSRGIAVVDVNYGGSSGFGRDYRRRLQSQWGVVDVEDCIAAAEYLGREGHVDSARMVIRGGSAGGLTVLRALQISKSFAAGTSLYGVTDLEMLAGDTHKFESRYLDGLIGGAYPEHKATYQERSPIHHTEDLNCPILVMQGDEDKVVPPNQSAAIADAAAAKGLPHAYVLFKGEQHGFRKTENIIRALQVELWFYSKVLGFDTSDVIAAPAEAVGL